VWLLIGLIIVTFIVDLIIPAAIAKWALLAPIFIPLFIRLGVAPQTVLAAYRVGDSPFNVITPLMAYFPLIVVFTSATRRMRASARLSRSCCRTSSSCRCFGRSSSSPGT
jgi:aminobenzoyl-glutamate transport protein